MATKTIILFLFFLPLKLYCSGAQTWIRSGYWFSLSELPISDINSSLFTNLFCAFAELNSSTYQLSLSSSDEQYFSAFTDTVKQKNPSIVSLLSIGGRNANTIFPSMINQSSYRKSFIESSIKTASLYGFHGLDFSWVSPSTSSDMTNIGTLLDEWRAAVNSESRNSNESQLILTMAVHYSPTLDSVSYPVGSIRRNLNWVRVIGYEYHKPLQENYTGANAALYDPLSEKNTDFGIGAWINNGLFASQIVLGLSYYGYAWKLVNPKDNALGAPAAGPAVTSDGCLSYRDIKEYIQRYGGTSVYNASYAVNYCTIGSTWIVFNDVEGLEAIRTKVSYAKEKRLLGYSVWQLSNDDNWVLSHAAISLNFGGATAPASLLLDPPQQDVKVHHNKHRLLVIILLPIAMVIFLLGFMMCYLRRSLLKSKGMMAMEKESPSKLEAAENLNSNAPNLQVFSFANIVAATNNFSIENKLGEGGYGPVYKGELSNGQEITVKRLSKTSKQGVEEFKNEVTLTAKLQHVNLV